MKKQTNASNAEHDEIRKELKSEFIRIRKSQGTFPTDEFIEELVDKAVSVIFSEGIEQGYAQALEDVEKIILSLLRLKCVCRIRGLEVDVNNAKSDAYKNYYSGALDEYDVLWKHLEELRFIIADIECAEKYLSRAEKLEFKRLKQSLAKLKEKQ